MRNPSDSLYKATISAYEIKNGQLLYYIEASDGFNKAYYGSEETPCIIDIKPFVATTTTTSMITTTTTSALTTTTSTTTTATTTTTSMTTSTTTTPTTTTTLPSLSIEKTNITLTDGDQYTINVNRNDVIYKSNNTNVAVVSSKGIITAIGAGNAIISIIDSESNVVQIKVNVISGRYIHKFFPWTSLWITGSVNNNDIIVNVIQSVSILLPSFLYVSNVIP